jgi:prepilin-type processing-associated H-X9-DG protein
MYNILPFIEETSVRSIGEGAVGRDKELLLGTVLATKPIGIYSCPSRRPAKARTYKRYDPWVNAWDTRLKDTARGDYAFCGGDGADEVDVGPESYKEGDSGEFEWIPEDAYTGVCYQRSRVNVKKITDGVTRTYLGGEKYLQPEDYETGDSWGDDASYYTGVDHDNLRWGADVPARDQRGLIAPFIFGAAHPGSFHMVMCDGSVQSIPYAIDLLVHQNLSNRHDGEISDLSNAQ